VEAFSELVPASSTVFFVHRLPFEMSYRGVSCNCHGSRGWYISAHMDIEVGLSNAKKNPHHRRQPPKLSIFSPFALIILIDLLYRANVRTLDDLF